METIGDFKVHKMASRLPMMPDDQLMELQESILTQRQLEPIIVTNDGTTVIDGRNRLLAIINLNKTLRGNEIKPWTITLREELKRMTASDEQKRFDSIGLEDAIDRGDEESIIRELVILKNVMRRHLTDWEKFKTLDAVTEVNKHGGDRRSNFQELKNSSWNSKNDLHGSDLSNDLNQGDAMIPPENTSLDELATQLRWSKAKLKQARYIQQHGTEEMKVKLASGDLSIGGAYNELKPPKEKEPKEIDIEAEIDKLAKKIAKQIETRFGILYWKQFKEAINNIKL